MLGIMLHFKPFSPYFDYGVNLFSVLFPALFLWVAVFLVAVSHPIVDYPIDIRFSQKK